MTMTAASADTLNFEDVCGALGIDSDKLSAALSGPASTSVLLCGPSNSGKNLLLKTYMESHNDATSPTVVVIKGDAASLLSTIPANPVTSVHRFFSSVHGAQVDLTASCDAVETVRRSSSCGSVNHRVFVMLEHLDDVFNIADTMDADVTRAFITHLKQLLQSNKHVNEPNTLLASDVITNASVPVTLIATTTSVAALPPVIADIFQSHFSITAPQTARDRAKLARIAVSLLTHQSAAAETTTAGVCDAVVNCIASFGFGFMLGDALQVASRALAAHFNASSRLDDVVSDVFASVKSMVASHIPQAMQDGSWLTMKATNRQNKSTWADAARQIPGVVEAHESPLSLWKPALHAVSGRKRGITAAVTTKIEKNISTSLLKTVMPANPRVDMNRISGQQTAKSVLFRHIIAPLSSFSAGVEHGANARSTLSDLRVDNTVTSSTVASLSAATSVVPHVTAVAEGVLLYGPPGTGKTLLAKAVATQLGARFISLSIPSLLRSGVGESEALLRNCFAMARAARPCVVFIDEIQALFVKRSRGESDANSRMSALLTTQLLSCMDEAHDNAQIVVLAATNVPESIDPSLFVPGRLSATAYVGLPDENDRFLQYKALLTPFIIQQSVESTAPLSVHDMCVQLSRLSAGLSGADIENTIQHAMRRSISDATIAASSDTTDSSNATSVSASTKQISLSWDVIVDCVAAAKPSVSAQREAELIAWRPTARG